MSAVQSVYLVLSGRLTPGEVSQVFKDTRARWKSARVVTSKETRGDHTMPVKLADRTVIALPESGVLSPAEVGLSQGVVVVLFRGSFLRTGSWTVEPVTDEEVSGVLRRK